MDKQVIEAGERPIAIPIIEEQLDVSRRTVDSGGGVRIQKVVHDEHVSITEPLHRESLEVVRKSVGRPVDGPVAIRHEGDVTIYPVVMERLITSKQLVLVEEIHVRRVAHVDHVTQDITLRREEAIVERQVPGSDEWVVEAPKGL